MCKTDNGKYKFSFMEMVTSGKDGSTSATGFVGVVLSLASMIMAVCAMLFYFFETGEATHTLAFLDKAIMIMGIGAGLLGTRKISGVIGGKKSSSDIQHDIDVAIDAREEREERIRRRMMNEFDSSYGSSEEQEEIDA